MARVRRDDRGEVEVGVQGFQSVATAHGEVDCAVVFDGCDLVTLLVPIERRVAEIIKQLEPYPLSMREREVAQLVVIGLRNREIAERLHVSVSTVKKHLYSIYGKLPNDRIRLLHRQGHRRLS